MFDFLTFLVLMFVFRANVEDLRTAWFLESVVSAVLVVLVVRTRRLVARSLPSKLLVAATVSTIIVTVSLPWLPVASLLGFAPLPASLFGDHDQRQRDALKEMCHASVLKLTQRAPSTG